MTDPRLTDRQSTLDALIERVRLHAQHASTTAAPELIDGAEELIARAARWTHEVAIAGASDDISPLLLEADELIDTFRALPIEFDEPGIIQPR